MTAQSKLRGHTDNLTEDSGARQICFQLEQAFGVLPSFRQAVAIRAEVRRSFITTIKKTCPNIMLPTDF